jgi:hypothetical protein
VTYSCHTADKNIVKSPEIIDVFHRYGEKSQDNNKAIRTQQG